MYQKFVLCATVWLKEREREFKIKLDHKKVRGQDKEGQGSECKGQRSKKIQLIVNLRLTNSRMCRVELCNN